jgi:hypothetical protein
MRIKLQRPRARPGAGGERTSACRKRPDEDALARQRKVIAWHPLRALNAVNVRVLGADLLAVHVTVRLQRHAGGRVRAARGVRGRPAGTPVLAQAHT